MPSPRFRLLAGSIAVAFVLAACGSSATQSPSESAAAASEAPASSAAAASEAPAAPSDNTGASPATNGGSGSTGGDLAASLPSSFGGQATTKLNLGNLPGASGLGGNSPVAIAGATSADGKVQFFAVRMQGVGAAMLQQAFLMAASASTGELQSVSVSGRSAFKTTNSSGEVTYFYVNGDTAYGASAPDDATAQQAFAALP